MMRLIIAAIFATVCLVDTVEPHCDDEFVKKIVIDVCGLNIKRSFDFNNNHWWNIFKLPASARTKSEIDHQFEQIMKDLDEKDELLLKKLNKTQHTESTTESQYQNNLSIYQDLKSRKKFTTIQLDSVGTSFVRKREVVSDLIKQCCIRPCNKSDFKNICETKK